MGVDDRIPWPKDEVVGPVADDPAGDDGWTPPTVYRTVDDARRRDGRQHRRIDVPTAGSGGDEPDSDGRDSDAPASDAPADDSLADDSLADDPRRVPPTRRSLFTAGIAGTRFSGRVVDVDDAEKDRPPPSASQLVVSGTILAVAGVLPFAVRALPFLALLVTLVVLFRPRQVLRRPRRRRQRPRTTTRLRAVSFTVRLVDRSGRPDAELPCRLVMRTEHDSPPLLGGEYVKGRGRRRPGGDTVDLRELVVESGPTYRAARLRSAVPVTLASAAALLFALVIVVGQRKRLSELAGEQLLPTVVAVVAPVVLVLAFKLYLRRRRRRRR